MIIERPANREEVGDSEVDADDRPSARAFSSSRMQPVLSVRSDGQTTRLKVALWSVRHLLGYALLNRYVKQI